MYLPTDNAQRSHAAVRQDCSDMQQRFLDRIYAAHQAIASLTYDGHSTPSWVEQNLQTIARIEHDLAEYEASNLLAVYFARATDAGVGNRKNIGLIHESLAQYASQVNRAIGSRTTASGDQRSPTGGSFGRRTGPNEVIRSREGTIPAYRRSPGLAGLLGGREFVGNQHVTLVTRYDNQGRIMGTSLHYRDCLGKPYWK